MASTVKFKFKSAKEYDTVSFPGTGIKLLDLKRAIVDQKKLHQGMEFDLNIVNDKTKEGTTRSLYQGVSLADIDDVVCFALVLIAGKQCLSRQFSVEVLHPRAALLLSATHTLRVH